MVSILSFLLCARLGCFPLHLYTITKNAQSVCLVRLPADRLEALLQESDDLLVAPAGLLDVYKVFQQHAVPSCEGEDTNDEEINGLEKDSVLSNVIRESRTQVDGHLGPVAMRVDVVLNVVAVVERHAVVRRVHDIVAVPEVDEFRLRGALVCRHTRINKDVLAPVAKHESEGSNDVRQDEGPPRTRRVPLVQEIQSREVAC